MHGIDVFYPMAEKIGENGTNDYNLKEKEGEIVYKNEDTFDNEEDSQDINDKLDDINQISINERAEENEARCQNQPSETHQKEYIQNIERTEHYETTTKYKTEITLKEDEDEKEIFEMIKELNVKRAKTNDKGKKTNQITNRIKVNSLYDMEKTASKMIKKTEYYKCNKKNLARIDKRPFEDSSKNLIFLAKTIKEVFSENKENEQIIKIITNNNDYPPLIKFLNMTIENFITLYSDKCVSSDLEEEYFLDLKKSYKQLKKKLRDEGKSDVYIESFTYFAAHIKYVYISIYRNKKKAKKLKDK